MDAVRDEDYVDFGISFQAVMVDHLNRVLKDKGIDAADDRKEICETFLMGLGNFLDQHWMEHNEKRVHPLLVFSETFMGVGVGLEDLGRVMFPPENFAHHEYSFGTVTDYFEDYEEMISDIAIGVVGDEDEEDEEDDLDIDDMG